MQERGAVYGAERLERSDASAGHQQAATSTSLAPTPPTVIQDMQNTREVRDTRSPKVTKEKHRKQDYIDLLQRW